MERLDGAVLDRIEATLLSPDRLEAIIARVAARAQAGETTEARRERLERQLREARAKVDRYVRAIGDGLDLAEIREQLTVFYPWSSSRSAAGASVPSCRMRVTGCVAAQA